MPRVLISLPNCGHIRSVFAWTVACCLSPCNVCLCWYEVTRHNTHLVDGGKRSCDYSKELTCPKNHPRAPKKGPCKWFFPPFQLNLQWCWNQYFVPIDGKSYSFWLPKTLAMAFGAEVWKCGHTRSVSLAFIIKRKKKLEYLLVLVHILSLVYWKSGKTNWRQNPPSSCGETSKLCKAWGRSMFTTKGFVRN